MQHLLLMFRYVEQEIIESTHKRTSPNKRAGDKNTFDDNKDHFEPVTGHLPDEVYFGEGESVQMYKYTL